MMTKTRVTAVWLGLCAAACSGGGGPPPGPVVASVVIAEPSVFLPGVGRSAQLTAVALDALGVPVGTPITWTSSSPAQVHVDSTGAVLASEIGSAQVFAEAGGVRSLPALVFAADPVPGALLVRDDQVVAIGPPLDVAPDALPGLGTRYEVRLAGLAAAPVPGTAILPAGSAVMGGKVVSSRAEGANLVVTLATAPIHELLDRYDFGWSIELGPQLAAQAAARSGLAGALSSPAAAPDAPESFRAFECDGRIEAGLLEREVSVTASVGLLLELFGEKPVAGEPPTYVRRAVTGTLSLTGTAALGFKANFSAEGECRAQRAIRIPAGGLLALVVMPQVRIGLGAGLDASLVVAHGKVGLTGTLSTTVSLGFECGGATPDCRPVESHPVVHRLKPIGEIPRLDDMHVELHGQVFAFIGLDAVFFLTLDAPILEGRFGPKQSFDMGFEQDQLTNPGYASSYDLALAGEVKPGSALQEGINAVFPGPAAVSFGAKTSQPISHSPTGTLSVDKAVTGPNQPVTITVKLDAQNLRYWMLDYNVLSIEIVRKREDEERFEVLASVAPSSSGDQDTFQHVWTPTEEDVGKNQLGALVRTKLDPLVPLVEVAVDSRKEVEVKCFTAPGGRSSARAASTCEDRWTGTSSTVITDATPQYRLEASVTWKYDPLLSFPPEAVYRPERGTATFSAFPDLPEPGCTVAITPSTFPITEMNGGELRLRYDTDPPTYEGFGTTLWAADYTLACPSGTVTFPMLGAGGSWFQGTGTVSADGLFIAGTQSSAGQTFTFSFVRP